MKDSSNVVFCAGNDPGQMMGAWLNWLRWGWEEHGVEINHAGAVQEWLAGRQGQNSVRSASRAPRSTS